jgi:Tol biopolymer transport system component
VGAALLPTGVTTSIAGVSSNLKWIVMVIVVGCASILPAAAQATLVFDRNPSKPSVWVAQNNGSGARLVAPGSLPRISPDGSTIAYMSAFTAGTYNPSLMVVPANGSAPPRLLTANWRSSYDFAWSPDSHTILTVVGPELGAQSLVSIEVATGAQRTIAKGFFNGVSFAPSGNQFVYARSATESFQSIDVYRASLSGGTPLPITKDKRSLSPLWGPTGQIVFVKRLEAKRRLYGPKNELYLMRPNGAGVRRLTHTAVPQLLQGLTPTAWSANGSRLLAEFTGEDTTYAETVNPLTGAHRPVGKAVENGFVGTCLSANGRTILGSTGGFDPSPPHNVVAIPYGGGSARVLARNASDPDWND